MRRTKSTALVAVTLIGLWLGPPSSASSLGREPAWVARYDGGGTDDCASAVAMALEGDLVYVTGESRGRHALVAYDSATGGQAWVAAGPRLAGGAYPAALAASPDGTRLFEVGYVYMAASQQGDYLTASYDARTGARLWDIRYDSGGDDVGTALALSPDGSTVYVTGSTLGGTEATIAYEATTGARRWTSRFSEGVAPRFVSASPDGSLVYITGGDGAVAVTRALHADTGMQAWRATYDGSLGQPDTPEGLAATPDGNRVVEEVANEGYFDTISLSAATGEEQWVTRDGAKGTGVPNSMTLSLDGARVFVTGQTSIENVHAITYAHDTATGASLWTSRLGASGEGLAIQTSPTGAFVLVAGIVSSPADDFLAAYDASTGHQLGVASYDSGGNDQVEGLVVTPDGSRAILAGSVDCPVAGDYLTVAYAPSALTG
jgi:PQQ-like domain